MLDGALPDCEKLAAVTPILKKPGLDSDSAANYQPISNMTFLFKLIEHLVCRQLTAHLFQHHLLPPQKSAYYWHHSIEIATLKVVSDIINAAETDHVIILALFDLTAAFDTVDHGIQLQQLSYLYDFGGTPLRWIRSFLSDRIQVSHFFDQQFAQSVLTCSVPQGSVSGSIMFTLYTTDVIRIALSFGVTAHCFADDLKLYVHCRTDEAAAAVARLIACIAAIEMWMGSNRLKVNPEKTKFIRLGSRNQLAAIYIAPLHLHDRTVIAPSTNVHNLGVIFVSEIMTMPDH